MAKSSEETNSTADGMVGIASRSRLIMAGALVESAVDDSRIGSLLPGTGAVKTLSLGLIFILLSRRQSVPVELEFIRGSISVRLFEPS